MFKHILKSSLIGASLFGFSSQALAELSPTHVAIGLKSLKFLQPEAQAGQTAVFIYKEGDAASEATAKQLANSLSGSVLTASVQSTANANFAGARLVFVTDGAMGDIAGLTAKARSANAAIISSQKACVEQGNCVIAVETAPKVQIYLSTSAAEQSNVSFSSAFMMLVKKL